MEDQHKITRDTGNLRIYIKKSITNYKTNYKRGVETTYNTKMVNMQFHTLKEF